MLRAIALVAAGSVAGGVLRFGLALAAQRFMPPSWPYGTAAANALGCLVLGVVWSGSSRLGFSAEQKLLLATGFCGSLTTFSTLIAECGAMLRAGQAPRAALYVALSLAAGLALFRAGESIGR